MLKSYNNASTLNWITDEDSSRSIVTKNHVVLYNDEKQVNMMHSSHLAVYNFLLSFCQSLFDGYQQVLVNNMLLMGSMQV